MKKQIVLFASAFVAWANLSTVVMANPTSGADLKISWEVIENNVNNETNFKSKFVIINKSKEALEGKNWNLYFNFCRKIKAESVTGNVSINHVNGDFFKVSPTAAFNLKPGDSVSIEYVSADWAINNSDAPAGLYIVFNEPGSGKENKPELLKNYTIKPFANPSQYKRFSGDNTPQVTPALLFEQNKNIAKISKDKLLPVIPVPVDYAIGNKTILLDPSFGITASKDLSNEKEYLSNLLNSVFVAPMNGQAKDKNITLQIGEFMHQGKTLKKGEEAYKLEIKGFKITITGTDAAGVFYGIQTLKALFPVEAFKSKGKTIALTEVNIIDYPRFHYRGMMLDVARNFQKKEAVIKYLDLLAYYKINKFHFHLTDDEGWRIQIKSLPELTEIGGNRGHDATGKGMVPSYASGPFNDPSVSTGSGYYTREDFIEILKYAKARHIEVIPEIDVPGHSRAAIKAMDVRYERLMKAGKAAEAAKFLLRDVNDQSEYMSVQMWNDNVLCICQPSALNFIDEVVKEMVAMYKEANAPIYTLHIGGDEVPNGVWEKSAVCKQLLEADPNLNVTEDLPLYFLKKMSEILAKYKLKVAGWEEIALKKVGKDHVVNTDFVAANFSPYIWNNVWGWGTEDNAYKLANAGYKVVLSNVTHLYFDLAYNRSPEEPGYYWGGFVGTKKPFEFIPMDIYKSANESRMGDKIDQTTLAGKERLTATGKANVQGLQGQLWTENTSGQAMMEYLSFPKIIGLAERAWAKDPTWASIEDESTRNLAIDKDWNIFANTIGQKELARLDYVNGGVAYRVSVPGAIIENGTLTANVDFPGLAIRYTTDGSEPTATSTLYSAPVAVTGVVKVKAFATNGRGSRTILVK